MTSANSEHRRPPRIRSLPTAHRSSPSATQQLASPFDYRRQVELHLFRNMPDPTMAATKFEEALVPKIQEYVQRTNGRAFVLFTVTAS